MEPGSWWRQEGDGITVSLHVVPNARRSEIVGVHDGRLRVRVAAPAVEGKANAALLRAVAGWFRVRKSAVTLVGGASSRHKTVRVAGIGAPPAGIG